MQYIIIQAENKLVFFNKESFSKNIMYQVLTGLFIPIPEELKFLFGRNIIHWSEELLNIISNYSELIKLS